MSKYDIQEDILKMDMTQISNRYHELNKTQSEFRKTPPKLGQKYAPCQFWECYGMQCPYYPETCKHVHDPEFKDRYPHEMYQHMRQLGTFQTHWHKATQEGTPYPKIGDLNEDGSKKYPNFNLQMYQLQCDQEEKRFAPNSPMFKRFKACCKFTDDRLAHFGWQQADVRKKDLIREWGSDQYPEHLLDSAGRPREEPLDVPPNACLSPIFLVPDSDPPPTPSQVGSLPGPAYPPPSRPPPNAPSDLKANAKGKNDQKGAPPPSGLPKTDIPKLALDKVVPMAAQRFQAISVITDSPAGSTITQDQIAESLAIFSDRQLKEISDAGKADDARSILEQQMAMLDDYEKQKKEADAQNPWQTSGLSQSSKPSSSAPPDVPVVNSPFAGMDSGPPLMAAGTSWHYDASYGQGKGAEQWNPDLSHAPERLQRAYKGHPGMQPNQARDNYAKGPYPEFQSKGKGADPSRQPPIDMSNELCYNCNAKGHWSHQCQLPKTEHTLAEEAKKARKRQESKYSKGKGKDESQPKGKAPKGDGKSSQSSDKGGGKKGSDDTRILQPKGQNPKGDSTKGKSQVKGDAKGKDAGGKPAGPINVSPSPPRPAPIW